MASSIWVQLKHVSITPIAAGVFSLISIAAVPLADMSAQDTLGDVGLELALGLIATLAFWCAFGLVVAVANRLFAPGWARQSMLLAALLFGGAIRGVLIFELADSFLFEIETGFGQRIANSVSTTVLWLTVLSLFSDATVKFRRRYEETFGQIALSRASRISNSEVAKILGGLESDLRELGDIDVDQTKARVELERIARRLERDILTSIKTHSAYLWQFAKGEVPRLRPLRLIRMSVTKLNYSITFAMVVLGLMNLLNVSSVVGFAEASWRVSIALGLMFALDRGYRNLLRPRLRNHALANLIYLVVVGFSIHLPLGYADYYLENSDAPWVFFTISSILASMLLVMLSTLNLAAISRRELLDEVLHTEVGAANEDGGSSASASLASFLHNTLQSEIQSIIHSLRSNQSGETGIQIGQSSLQRLRILSTRSLDERFAQFATLPREHLDDVIQGWAGILDISLTWQLEAESSGDLRLPTVVQIIEEVASNAVVHGGASEMSVTVDLDGEDILVKISNNGRNEPKVGAGQGSKWLEAFADHGGRQEARGVFGVKYRIPAPLAD